MNDRIVQVDVWCCPLPMTDELHLGAITYATREVVVLRMITSEGLQGTSIGYTRGTPLIHALRTLVAQLSSLETIDPSDVATALRGRFAPGWGAMVRAASLIDIALWDIAARRQERSISALFGKHDRDLPLMAVAGYFLDQRGHGAIVDEVRRFADEKYETIKLIVPGYDLSADVALVSDVSDVLRSGMQLAIDFHGAFQSTAAAGAYCRVFDEHGLRFIEDPFPSYVTDAVCEVASSIQTPVASGEDLIDVASYRMLLAGGTRYLRVDPTATGGYGAALDGIKAAENAGAIVAPHVWPHLNFPLASSSTSVGMIEVIPHSTGADPIDLLLEEPFPIRNGQWSAPAQPGLYLPFDWLRVDALAAEHWHESC